MRAATRSYETTKHQKLPEVLIMIMIGVAASTALVVRRVLPELRAPLQLPHPQARYQEEASLRLGHSGGMWGFPKIGDPYIVP